ncbi:3-deoxy-D-manno-octulosonate 8-phosphate phosphatase (KDO 8-P phosphatase) [Thermodesulfobium acidiphilum]|uniref:3-deoxy-D-manno-octulosonate 8-phosphate phosphatase (KDO 8-P phosphatase) n=1 Tax=Thermodesulfobium acidiphilum TaxID=1794699 RepID=A0A2R4VYB5_THEAF|nr:HAD hydrolase family protein [Thermodesulfobium acidiphilum]AWB09454.1 3-deoxy-D-manno-octulosonate 8-phosphate phosphatase (KDO 8-P phosphatase) [Thermodesulfobium acidiphilum]
MSLEDRIKNIKLMGFDVDGVLTDGSILLTPDDEIKIFNVKDGLGITMARKLGFIIIFISGRKSLSLEKRAKELKVDYLITDCDDKISELSKILEELNMDYENLAYMGDDYNDLSLLEICGVSACPGDALEAVKERVDMVIEDFGGKGAVRSFIEKILRVQNKLDQGIKFYFKDY